MIPFGDVSLILVTCSLFSLSPLEAASVRQAKKAYERESFETALNQYKELLEEKPEDHRLHYNAGIAAYRAGRPTVAAEHFSRVTMSPDLTSQQPAYYNLGNALYQIGAQADTPEQKMEAWQKAIKSFEGAVKLNELDDDARHNLDIVKKLLEELQQEQQQQQNDQSNDQEENEDEREDENDSQSDENEQNEQQDSSSDENESEDQNQNESSSEEEEQSNQEQPPPQPSQDQSESEQPEEQQPQNQPQQQDSSGQEDEGDDEPNSDSQAQALPAGQMSEEEAKQLLESLKDDEQTIVFLPERKKQSKANSGKDW